MKEKILQLKSWWSNLPAREKRALSIGAPVVLIFIFYQFIWAPIVDANALLRNKISSGQKTLAWMQAADDVMQKMEINNRDNKSKSISLVAYLDLLKKQIDKEGMGQSLTQLKQVNNDSIDLHFQKVDFDKLAELLIETSKNQGAIITRLGTTAEHTNGHVNADVTLRLSI